MSQLSILEFPDPWLRRIAEPVTTVGAEHRQLAAEMLEAMYAAQGIGLAATQVGRAERLFVLDVSQERNQPRVFINPEIIDADGECSGEEGCLSIPGVTAEVVRAETIRLRALNLDGESIEEHAEGLMAVCIQHEIDHLDGKVFLDRLSPLKRRMIQAKLRKQRQRPDEDD
jgi:peptide deformylase